MNVDGKSLLPGRGFRQSHSGKRGNRVDCRPAANNKNNKRSEGEKSARR